jgi:hypothetical protein
MAKGGLPIGEYSGSDATKALHDTIKKYQEESSRQTDKMVKLTVAITWLTVVMLIAVLVQIYLTIFPVVRP